MTGHHHPASQITKRAIVASIIFHLAFLMIVIVIPGSRLLFRERPMKVIWVNVPKGPSENINIGMKETKTLPRSTIEQQKKKSGKQKHLKPTRKAPFVLAKPKKKKRARKKLSASERRIKRALAKLDNLDDGAPPEAAQIKEKGEGFKYGTGNQPLKAMPSDVEYIKYQSMVRGKIIQQWIIPIKLTREDAPQLNAKLEVMIDTSGDITSIRWDKPSGNASFDTSAIRAVKKASPFPKPPDKLAWEAYNEGFLVEFDPHLKR